MRARPPILFAAAFGAGLVTGLAHYWAPACVLLLGAMRLMRSRPFVRLLAAAALLGLVAAGLARARDDRGCAARLPAGRMRLTVRTLEPADRAAGRVRLAPVAAGCSGAVDARWSAETSVGSGRAVTVLARWTPRSGALGRPAGTLTVVEADSVRGAPGSGDRLRDAVVAASRRLYGRRAPMVEALVLGRRGGMDRDLQDRFAESGLVHLLSISGFHVGLISAWVFLIARLCGAARPRALAIASATSVAYVALLGWPAPATRAAALGVALALSQVRQRRPQADALLSATCLCVLLLDPWAIVDLGGWLSASALWGAVTFTRWTDRRLGTQWWWRGLGSSVGATLATAPVTAATLGTVAPVGIVLNFAAIPIAAVAVPGVIASLILAPLGVVATGLAAGAGLALHLLELLAVAGARVPFGHLTYPEEPASALPWIAALAAALWGAGRHTTAGEAVRRWGWLAAGLLWVALVAAVLPRLPDGGSGLALHFLDVGQGDAAAIRTPGGRWVVVDAGPAGPRSDAGRRVVVPFLRRQGAREVAALVVSHAHLDHLGGAGALLGRLPVRLVIEPGDRVDDPVYHAFLAGVVDAQIPWHAARRGERFELDGVRFTVLHPDTAWTEWGFDLNEDSVVLRVEYGDFQALLTGDAGFPAESLLRGSIGPVDVLKVGHHGSRGSTGGGWLAELGPRVAVISVGENRYGHPAPETLARLRAAGADVRRTDQDGTVSIMTDGRSMRVVGRSAVGYDVR